MTPREQNLIVGATYGIIAAFCFATMSVFVKLIGNDLPTSMVLFARFFTGLMVILPWVIVKPDFSFKVSQPIRYVVRILSTLTALFCIFYAIKFMSLATALLLSNTAPFFVPLIAWLTLGIKTPKPVYFGILIGFIGVGLVLSPSKEIFSFPALIGLSSGLLVAISMLQIRLMSKTNSVEQVLFYYFLISAIILGVLAFAQWKTPSSPKIWLFLLGVGIFGTLHQIFSTVSYATAPVRLMSPLIFLMVFFGGIFDWLLWNKIPSWLAISGALCIILGILVTVYFGKNEIMPKLINIDKK